MTCPSPSTMKMPSRMTSSLRPWPPAPPPEHLRIILEIRPGQAATPVPPIGQEMASRRRSPERRERQPRDSSISAEGIALALIRLMTTRLRRTAAAAFLNRLWSLVPSGGSLPEGVWRARHRFLVGLTFFHVLIIALAGPVLGKQVELSLRALFH